MIKILIIDDSDSKRNKIKNVILDSHDIQETDIKEAKNTKEARRILYKEYFDLMILDLVLPIEENGDCNAKNGADLLHETEINPSINPPIHIVGLSGYKEEINEYNDSFRKKLWNLIEYEESSYLWQDQLKSIIYHLVKIRQQYIDATFSNQSDILVKYLEKNNIPNTCIGFNWENIPKNIADIIEKSLDVPSKFANGTKAKKINNSTIKIESEYDFQNLIHIVLRPWLPTLEAENIAVIFDGNTKNADFSIKGNTLIIEAKYIDTTGKKNDTLKTLEGLKSFYSMNANVKALLFLILVNENVKIDKHKIESEYSQLLPIPICVTILINKLK